MLIFMVMMMMMMMMTVMMAEIPFVRWWDDLLFWLVSLATVNVSACLGATGLVNAVALLRLSAVV